MKLMTRLMADQIFKLIFVQNEKVAVLLERAYDKFDIKLRSLQVLFLSPSMAINFRHVKHRMIGEINRFSADDWKAARNSARSDLHILQPTGFDILIKKATIADLRLPQ